VYNGVGAVILLCGRCTLLHRAVRCWRTSRPAFISSAYLIISPFTSNARGFSALPSFLQALTRRLRRPLPAPPGKRTIAQPSPLGMVGRFVIGNKNRSFAVGKTKRRGRAGGTFPKRSKHPEGAELQRRAGGTLGQLWGCRLCRPHGPRSGPRVTPAYPVR